MCKLLKIYLYSILFCRLGPEWGSNIIFPRWPTAYWFHSCPWGELQWERKQEGKKGLLWEGAEKWRAGTRVWRCRGIYDLFDEWTKLDWQLYVLTFLVVLNGQPSAVWCFGLVIYSIHCFLAKMLTFDWIL